MASTVVASIFAYHTLIALCRFMCLEFSRVPVEPLRKAYDWYSFNVIPTIGEVCVTKVSNTVSSTREKRNKRQLFCTM